MSACAPCGCLGLAVHFLFFSAFFSTLEQTRIPPDHGLPFRHHLADKTRTGAGCQYRGVCIYAVTSRRSLFPNRRKAHTASLPDRALSYPKAYFPETRI
ncbi:hypothetical protein C8Q79DRAFT_285243 [Trametes meyenii]|nr:hypothetical protein C8Q79DRAFT_285243 [Trametes meyenii]